LEKGHVGIAEIWQFLKFDITAVCYLRFEKLKNFKRLLGKVQSGPTHYPAKLVVTA